MVEWACRVAPSVTNAERSATSLETVHRVLAVVMETVLVAVSAAEALAAVANAIRVVATVIYQETARRVKSATTVSSWDSCRS